MTNIDDVPLKKENKETLSKEKPEGEEDKKLKSEELDKVKIGGDQIDKKPEKPTKKILHSKNCFGYFNETRRRR